MATEFVLSQGAGQKLEFAVNRNGGGSTQVEWLSTGDNFKLVMALVAGTHKIVPINAVVTFLSIKVEKVLDPEAFIGKGWKFAKENRQPTKIKIKEIDFTKVTLANPLKEGESWINGEDRLKRLNDGATRLGADQFLACWEHREELPEDWKPFVITFDDEEDVLLSPNGGRYVLYLCWRGYRWRWFYVCLDRGFGALCRSASLVK